MLGDYSPSGRRVDFLAHAPFGTPFVVEIDGTQHQDSSSPDSERDRLLDKVGIEVVRVPTTEIDQGHGENLERIRHLWAGSQGSIDKRIFDAILVPVSIHRLVIALLDAVDAGILKGQTWTVEVEGDPDVDPVLIGPYVRLFGAMDRLWGPSMMPNEIVLKSRRGWTRFDAQTWEPPAPLEQQQKETDLTIRLATAFNVLRQARKLQEYNSGNRSAKCPTAGSGRR